MHVSDDLHSWRACGAALDARRARWGTGCFWAPECYEIDGKYYLFYSADWKENPTGALENFRIGVAVADTPAGPFADLSDRPVFDPGYPVIDANLYREDGRCYLYYSRCCYEHRVGQWEESWIYGVELKPDFSGVTGEPVLQLRPEQDWGRPQRRRHRPPLERRFLPAAAGRAVLHDLLRQLFCGAGLCRRLRHGRKPAGAVCQSGGKPDPRARPAK